MNCYINRAQLREEVSSIKTQNSVLEAKNREISDKRYFLENQINAIQSSDTSIKMNELIKENTHNEERLRSMRSEAEERSRKISSLELEKQEILISKIKLTDENSHLREKVEIIKIEREGLQSQNSMLKGQIRNLEREKADLKASSYFPDPCKKESNDRTAEALGLSRDNLSKTKRLKELNELGSMITDFKRQKQIPERG